MKNMNGFLKDICIFCFRLSSVLPDRLYLKIIYRIRVHKKLNLDNPQTFTEKIQRMKLEDHNPLYPLIADKYEVRKYVEDRIGAEYLTKLYGIYTSPEEIDFSNLPDKFVLKTTHDSGGCIIVNNKNEIDIVKNRKKLHRLMKRNFYWKGREWCYKDIRPRIICEEVLEDPVKQDLWDYKFFCFHGEPKMLLVATERKERTKYDFFDLDFQHLDIINADPMSGKELEKPKNFDKMIDIARMLSKDLEQVRVDLYNIEGRIYFGELTLYHSSGLDWFEPDEWDKKIGDWW